MKIRPDAWIISDTHFGHTNIIKYCNRPFRSIEQMEDQLIHNWNKTVSKRDQVLFLGDFGFGEVHQLKKWAQALNGDIIMILGNHDRSRSTSFWRNEIGMQEVYPEPIIYKKFFILSHEPIDWVSPKVPVVNIHGHSHDLDIFNINNHHINICVEQINYTPIRLNSIIKVCAEANEGLIEFNQPPFNQNFIKYVQSE